VNSCAATECRSRQADRTGRRFAAYPRSGGTSTIAATNDERCHEHDGGHGHARIAAAHAVGLRSMPSFLTRGREGAAEEPALHALRHIGMSS
jgi:hypothetical protein